MIPLHTPLCIQASHPSDCHGCRLPFGDSHRAPAISLIQPGAMKVSVINAFRRSRFSMCYLALPSFFSLVSLHLITIAARKPLFKRHMVLELHCPTLEHHSTLGFLRRGQGMHSPFIDRASIQFLKIRIVGIVLGLFTKPVVCRLARRRTKRKKRRKSAKRRRSAATRNTVTKKARSMKVTN